MRLTSDFWVSALIRQVRTNGGFAYLTHRGASEAGAIFIEVRQTNGCLDLYSPAPQSFYDDAIKDGERLFICVANDLTDEDLVLRIEKELRFDPDLWLVELEAVQNGALPFKTVAL